MTEYCNKHRGKDAPKDLVRVMKQIPLSQAGEGRHRCAECAYEKGIEDGIKLERERIMKLIKLGAGR